MSWKTDRREKEIFCDKCGQGILDTSTCKIYRAGPPYYDNFYICADCLAEQKKNLKEVTDEDDGK